MLSPDMQQRLPGAAREGAALVGVSVIDDPVRIVTAVNTFVANPPKARFFKKVDNWNDRALPLGALWGEQLVRAFGWQWMLVHIEDDTEIGVFSAERGVGVYPFDYVFGCLESGEYPTILLAFNMLAEGSLPAFQDRSYVNLMDGVQHIVPPA